MNKNFWTISVSFVFFLGCGSGSDDFNPLNSSDVSEIEQTTITQVVPDAGSVTIEQSQTQQFFVTAEAPLGRGIVLTWEIDGTSVQQGSSTNYSITGDLTNIGDHTLTVSAYDGVSTDEHTWDVRVNGPPVVTKVTTGTPKVSVGSSISIAVTATDPNSDSLTYEWLINGASSAYLTGSGSTATLTGADALVGQINIQVNVSDGTATTQETWVAEVNHFPMACNELEQGEICTIAGSPSVGDNTNPLDSEYDLRIRPIDMTQDALGNMFIADYENHLVWYWNKTAGAVNRVGQTIAANTIKVVAGTGEANSGSDGPALETAIYNPRSVAYNDATGVLYISEYNGHRIKYVDSNGNMFIGMGFGSSHVDGNTAYNHDCDNPVTIRIYSGSLYVACRSENRVKKWDLATDLATTVYGDGGDDVSGENADALTSGARRPMGLHVDATGIYVTHSDNNRIRYVNTTGATVTFWGDVSVGAGNVRTIIGTGSTGYQTNGKPTTLNTGDPEGVYHINNRIYYTFRDRDKIALANNTGADITIGARTIANNEAGYLNAAGTSSGYNGTNVDLDIAQLNEPYNIFPDVSDSDVLYIADYNNRRIRSIDVGDAKMYDILGSGTSRYGFLGDVDKPSIDHLFNQLGGLAYESSSRTLFFVDQNNYRVRQMTPYGEISTAVGRGNGNPEIENDVPSNAFTRVQYSGDNYMNGAALLSDGSLIQLNTRGHSFRIWNRTISNKTYFGTFILSDRISNVAGDPLGATNGPGDGPDGPALSHEFNYPTDVAVYNDSGNDVIFIADQQNHCIKQLDNTGNVTSVLGTCGSSGNSGNNNVAEGSVQFNRPHGLAVDSIGNLIITDSWNSKVRYWNRTGSPVMVGNLTVNANSVSTIACNSGTSGSPSEGIFATSARCYRPLGVDVNEDYICFANTWDHNVRCIDLSDGRISTVSGNLEATRRAGSPYGLEQEGITGTSATHYYPGDVLFDENGDLFIGDRANHVVRKLKLSSD